MVSVGFCLALAAGRTPTTMPADDPARPGYHAAPGVVMSPVQEFLDRGDTAAAARAMTNRLKADPNDDGARFALGAVQFFQAVEHASQRLYRGGISPRVAGGLSMMELKAGLRDNPNPLPVNYGDVHAFFQSWVDDLAVVDQTLSAIKDPNVQLRLRIGTIKLDFVGDGKPTDAEALSNLWPADFIPAHNASNEPIRRNWNEPTPGPTSREVAAARDEIAESFYVKFDHGDVYWLQGYCHLLSAISDVILTYDEKDLFDHTAHIVFKDARTPFPFLKGSRRTIDQSFTGDVDIADVITFIHLLHLPVADKSKMVDALHHFRAALQCSRDSWKAILAETGDDHEWVPNPHQTPVFASMDFDRKMIDRWLRFLDEADAILDGKKLAPFWRGEPDDGVGINVNKLFNDPPTFDPFLMFQGSAFGPYLEKGTITDRKVFEDLDDAFGSELPAFTFWIN